MPTPRKNFHQRLWGLCWIGVADICIGVDRISTLDRDRMDGWLIRNLLALNS